MNLETLNRKTPLLSLFRFFASVKLAIPLLAGLMASLAAGTFVESWHGADAAKIVVYDSAWFSALMVLLSINLAVSAFSRWPWKKKHIGFVITHLGIIVILAGSLATQKTMIDGQMAMAEGETESRITLQKPLLYIYSPADQMDWLFFLDKKAFPWQGNQKLEKSMNSSASHLPFGVSLVSYYPHASFEENFKASDTGPAALRVTLKNSFLNQSQWLLLNDPQMGRIQMGPARLVFTDKLLKENNTAASTPYLEIEKDGDSTAIALPEDIKVPAEFQVEGTPFTIRAEKIFKNAAVSGNKLIEENDSSPNPAVQLTVMGPEIEEKHTAFSNFPDFPTMHGMKPSATGMRIFYRMPEAGSRGQSHELRFVQTLEGLKVQVRTGLQVKTQSVEKGVEVPLGWMDLTYKVEEYLPKAAHDRVFTAVEAGPQAQEPPAIQIKAGEKNFWIGQGMKTQVALKDKTYDFVFGEKRIPAGFKLTLKDFRVENYPGTEKPASFESDVVLKDEMRGVEQAATISMNKPLVYRGYRIYQASYSAEEGQPEISVFAVGKDPGVPVKYFGALIMVIGIVTMFFTRKPARPLEPATGES